MGAVGSGIPPWTKLFNRQEVMYQIVTQIRKEMPVVVRDETRNVMEQHGVAAGTVTQGKWVAQMGGANYGANGWRKLWRKCET